MWFYVWHAALAASCAYAFLCGGAPERAAAAILAAGSVATPFVLRSAFGQMEPGMLAIDLIDQVALMLLMLWADRFWLVLLAGLHLLEPLIGLAKSATPAINPGIYARAENGLGCLMLFLIAIGTRRHRARLRRYGADPSWSASLMPWSPRPPRGGQPA